MIFTSEWPWIALLSIVLNIVFRPVRIESLSPRSSFSRAVHVKLGTGAAHIKFMIDYGFELNGTGKTSMRTLVHKRYSLK